MTRARASLAILVLAATGLAGCGSGGGDAKPKPKLRVVATTAQVADFLRAVGGSRVEVDQLIPNGSDPHKYKPRAGVEKMLKDADLVIRSGGGLDTWLPALAKRAGVDDIDIVDLSKAVVLRERNARVDFHWWQDPRNVAAAALKVRDELIKRDADGSRPYRAAAARYLRKLGRLDRASASCLADVHPGARRLFTVHDAFGYLAARYRLTVAGSVLGTMTTQTPAITQDRLPSTIRSSGAPAVFAEHASGFGEALARAARRAGVPVAGMLFADTLGAPGSADARYVGAFAHNVETIAEGLGAPAGSCRLPE